MRSLPAAADNPIVAPDAVDRVGAGVAVDEVTYGGPDDPVLPRVRSIGVPRAAARAAGSTRAARVREAIADDNVARFMGGSFRSAISREQAPS